MHRSRAFTLVELLCVLAVTAILLALSATSWERYRAGISLRGATDQTLAGLALARRTALASGQTVTLCLTRDTLGCDLAGREWMLFANAAGGSNARREAGEALLRRWALPAGIGVGGSRSHAYYLPQTRAAATVTFTFCHAARPELARSVVVSQTGRPRISFDLLSSRTEHSPCRR